MTNIDSILADLEASYPGITSHEEIEAVNKREAADLENCIPNESLTSDNAWGWARKMPKEVSVKQFEPALNSVARASAKADSRKANKAKNEFAIDKKRRKQEIVNEAINSNFIDLNSPLTIEHKKLLISLLTKNYTDRMTHHDSYIQNVVEAALRKVIPSDLLNTFAKFPDAVVPFPGFTYTASKEYGQELQFRIRPNLPMYFSPDDCTNILKKLLPHSRLASLDKAIALFYKYKNTRSQREVKIAEALTRIHTFFQLVKKDPFWYDSLVNELKSQQNEVQT